MSNYQPDEYEEEMQFS